MAGKHKVILSERAREDLLRLVDEGYGDKVDGMLTGLEEDPFRQPYQKLSVGLEGRCARRINLRDRLVYKVIGSEEGDVVLVLRMKGTYRGIDALLSL